MIPAGGSNLADNNQGLWHHVVAMAMAMAMTIAKRRRFEEELCSVVPLLVVSHSRGILGRVQGGLFFGAMDNRQCKLMQRE